MSTGNIYKELIRFNSGKIKHFTFIHNKSIDVNIEGEIILYNDNIPNHIIELFENNNTQNSFISDLTKVIIRR